MISVLLLSLALALDALSVSIVEGAVHGSKSFKLAFKLALVFGIFQSGMATLGYFFSILFSKWVSAVDHWIAFVLLSLIGLNMMRAAFKKESEEKRRYLSIVVLLLLGLATSIDAWVAGITLGNFILEIWMSLTLIGLTTFILCFLGTLFGQMLEPFSKKLKIEVLGGIILVAIGVQVLIGHIWF